MLIWLARSSGFVGGIKPGTGAPLGEAVTIGEAKGLALADGLGEGLAFAVGEAVLGEGLGLAWLLPESPWHPAIQTASIPVVTKNNSLRITDPQVLSFKIAKELPFA